MYTNYLKIIVIGAVVNLPLGLDDKAINAEHDDTKMKHQHYTMSTPKGMFILNFKQSQQSPVVHDSVLSTH